MANVLSIKRRINAARNVSKTTKALQMMSASKLKKAQQAVITARPYVQKISEISGNIRKSLPSDFDHPYLKQNKGTDKTLLVVLSPDKGLSGSLVTNIVREFANYQKTEPETSYIVMGKKLEGRITKLSKEIIAFFAFGTVLPGFDLVYPLKKLIDDYYKSGQVKSVKVLFTEYVNVFTQTPKITELLPVSLTHDDEAPKINKFSLYEPDKEYLLGSLFEHYLEMTIYQQLVESYVSEHAARMTAMQNATDNANDIIDDLQLEYNKTRQAKITSELLDITGGSTIRSD